MSGRKLETGHQDQVHDATMDYYGKRLATASSDSTIRIHTVGPTSSTLATLTGHIGPVWRVSWAHPKFGSILASCGFDGKVVIWKETSSKWAQLHVFADHKSSVNSISWAPHELGLCLASGSSDGSISVFTYRSDSTGWDTARIERAHPVGVTAVSWAPVGAFSGELVQKIASGGFDSSVRVWEMSNGSWRSETGSISQVHNNWVRDVAWAPALGLAKSTIASCSQDGMVVIWTKEGGQWRGKLVNNFGKPVWRVCWELTGSLLSVSDADGDVMLWKEKEGQNGHWEQVTKVGVDV